MNVQRQALTRSKANILAGILAAVMGIYYLWLWLQNGIVLTRGGSWVPSIFLITGAAAIVGAIGFVMQARWGVIVFMVAALCVLARLVALFVTPVGYLDTFATISFLISALILICFTLGAWLIAVVMIFHRRWLSILGLGIATLAITVPIALTLLVH